MPVNVHLFAGVSRRIIQAEEQALAAFFAKVKHTTKPTLSETSPNKSHSLQRDLVAHWMFNEEHGQIVQDVSRNGHTGDVTNADLSAIWVPSEKGIVMDFADSDDYVNVPHNAAFNSITGPLTISAWVTLNGVGDIGNELDNLIVKGRSVTGDGDSTSSPYAIGILVSGGNKFLFSISDSTDDRTTLTSTSTLSNDVWYHVVVTWDGTTGTDNMKIYIDGLLDATKSQTDTVDLKTNTDDIVIGADKERPTERFAWGGLVSDVRLYKRELKAAEIRLLFDNPYIDYPLERFAAIGLSELGALAAFYSVLKHTTKPLPSQAVPEKAHSLQKDLVAHWMFNEEHGQLVHDYSRNNHTGDITNADLSAIWVPSEKGIVMDFADTDDHVNVPHNAAFNSITGPLTISAWVTLNGVGDAGNELDNIILKGRSVTGDGDSTSSPYALGILISGGNKFLFSITDSTDDRTTLTSTSTLSNDVWYHVVVTWDGTTGTDNMKIYIDGLLDATKSQTDTVDLKTNTDDISIGFDKERGTERFAWGGLISDVRLYKRELKAAEIRLLFDNPYIDYKINRFSATNLSA